MIIIEPPPKGILGYEFYRMAIIALSDILGSASIDEPRIVINDCKLFSAKIKNILKNDLVEKNLFFTGNDKKNIASIARLLGIKSAERITAYDLLNAYADYVANNCGDPPQRYRNIMYPNIFKLNYYELKRDFSSKPTDVRGDLHQIMIMILGALIAKTGISRRDPRRLTYYTMMPSLPLGLHTKIRVQDQYLWFKSFRRILRELIDEPEHIKRMALVVEAALGKKEARSTQVLDAVYQAITSEQGNRATLIEYNIVSVGDELSFFEKLGKETLLTLRKMIEIYVEASRLAQGNKVMAKIANTILLFTQYIMLYLETRNTDYAYNAIAIIERTITNPARTEEHQIIDKYMYKNMGPRYNAMISTAIRDIVDKTFTYNIV